MPESLDRFFLDLACAKHDVTYTVTYTRIGSLFVAEHVEETPVETLPGVRGDKPSRRPPPKPRPLPHQVRLGDIEVLPCVFCQPDEAAYVRCSKCGWLTCIGVSSESTYRCRPACGNVSRLNRPVIDVNRLIPVNGEPSKALSAPRLALPGTSRFQSLQGKRR